MKVYSVDVMICATAYIKARSPADAMKKLARRKMAALEVADAGAGMTVQISDLQYSDPTLPNFSLSPAMTLHGRWKNETPGVAYDPNERD